MAYPSKPVDRRNQHQIIPDDAVQAVRDRVKRAMPGLPREEIISALAMTHHTGIQPFDWTNAAVLRLRSLNVKPTG